MIPENEGLDEAQHESWLTFWDELTQVYGEYLPSFERGDLLKLSENPDASLGEVAEGIIRFLFHEVAVNVHIIVWLLVLLLMGAILQTIGQSFGNDGISSVGGAATTGILLLFVMDSVTTSVTYVQETVQQMTDFMHALLPLFLAMIALSGGMITAALSQPLLLFMVQFCQWIMGAVLIPLIVVSMILDVVDTLSDSFNTAKMAALCRQISSWGMGIAVVLFSTLFSVQGMTSAVSDGVAAKTIKSAVGNFVPFIGKTLADTTDLVIATSVLAKNGVGIAGILVLFLVVLFPFCKVVVVAFLYRLCAVVIEPLGHKGMVQAVDAISRGLFYLSGMLALSSLLFLLSLLVLLFVSNVPLMVR